MNKKRLLSGIQSSGKLHIGNYFGAIKQFVDLQDTYECYLMIADYHALTSLKNKEEMRQNIIDITLDYLALGLDPEKVTIFKQSDVAAHPELAWILETVTTMPFLMRAHAFKDAEAKSKEINVGLFNYPVLMAADILLYDSDIVPVGADQKQHIEITRDIAEKFNLTYGETFKLPEAYIMDNVATVPGLDGRKMSKSYKNTIPIFAEEDELKKAVMSIVTNSDGGVPENVLAIHKLITSDEMLEKLYKEKEGKYKDLKEALFEDLNNFLRPFREKRKEYEQNLDLVMEILEKGGEQARSYAEGKMEEVREKIGVKLY